MKRASIYLLIVGLLIAAITAAILYSRWQQQRKATEDTRSFRQAEQALDKLFQLPADMQRPSTTKEP